MNGMPASSGVEKVASRLSEAEAQLGSIANECTRVRKSLKKAADELAKSPLSIQALESVLQTLNRPSQVVTGAQLDQLRQAVEAALASMRQSFDHEFRRQIKASAEQEQIFCGTSGDNVTIGPFELIVDRGRNVAELAYAKVPAVRGLPFDAKSIVEAAQRLQGEILQAPEHLPKLLGELEEAILVAIARDKKSTRLPELRAELPTVYREMTFIRQAGKKPVSKSSFRDYPLGRFVVEVASAVRADQNISAAKSVRLETAVIENAGNPRKAVFIPKDLTKGYGEGMYYQAIVLKQPE